MVRSLARLQFSQNSNHVRLFQLMTVDNDSPIVYTKYTNKSKMLLKNSSFDFFFIFEYFFYFFSIQYWQYLQIFHFFNFFGNYFQKTGGDSGDIPETISRSCNFGAWLRGFSGNYFQYLEKVSGNSPGW